MPQKATGKVKQRVIGNLYGFDSLENAIAFYEEAKSRFSYAKRYYYDLRTKTRTYPFELKDGGRVWLCYRTIVKRIEELNAVAKRLKRMKHVGCVNGEAFLTLHAMLITNKN
jgi:hypothetical protein